jgi:hypothetical protein
MENQTKEGVAQNSIVFSIPDGPAPLYDMSQSKREELLASYIAIANKFGHKFFSSQEERAERGSFERHVVAKSIGAVHEALVDISNGMVNVALFFETDKGRETKIVHVKPQSTCPDEMADALIRGLETLTPIHPQTTIQALASLCLS